ncbi:MAG: LytTR family DNA-binding domain-containing protein [Bacteroidales bacterium]|nr:LytTR family DNA-binding domain-containing protein [Bacteroidales bacterium]
MIRTLIVEDEQHAARRLQNLLRELDSEIEIAGVTDTVESTVDWLGTNPSPDLIMLDIQLGDGLGFSIFSRINVDSYIIFTTAFDEYAIKAFELNSIGYLLKPVDSHKLSEALSKFRKLGEKRQNIDIAQIIKSIEERNEQYKKRFIVNVANRIRIIETGAIAYFYSMEKSSFFCTFDNKHYPVEFSLDSVEGMVNMEHFFRINRAFLINLKAITRIDILSKSRIKLTVDPPFSGEVMVSGTKSPEFRAWLEK